jgi:hypothetical protein
MSEKSSLKSFPINKQSKSRKLQFPFKQLRTIFSAMTLLLFIIYLQIFLYALYLIYNWPHCAKCDQIYEKNCDFCDTLLDKFIVNDKTERKNWFTYFCFLLVIRCVALILRFFGVFFILCLISSLIVLYSCLMIVLVIVFAKSMNKLVLNSLMTELL